MHHCKCECKHEHVKYCSKCRKVHCEDCGREWEDKCTCWHYPHWTSSAYIGNTASGTTSAYVAYDRVDTDVCCCQH
jgi:hypothetical protein